MDLLAAARIYRRVVECASISGAAKSLELSQPTVSERIERLEAYLGVRLLMRSARALTCTEEGQVFYRRSRELIDAAERTISATTATRDLRGGMVRIASAQCFGETVLPQVLGRVRETHPQLRLDLMLNDAVVDPITEGADISLRVGKLGEGGYVAHRLGHIDRCLVATPEYLARHGTPGTPLALRDHPFIRVKGIFSSEQLPLMRAGRKLDATAISTSVTTSHWRPMYELIHAGAGIGVLQYPACAADLAQGRLVQLLPQFSVPSFPLNALVQPSRTLPPRVRAVLDCLKQEIPALLERCGH